ncbi:MAG: InlB B-repeat-containing protein [Bacilli bacterium]|nr:InlB B-repeat-containing protein [Bacilli bacterium]
MKKLLIGLGALAMAAGVGSAVAVNAVPVREAKAATTETTFYVDVSTSYWSTLEGFSIGNVKVHYWVETGDKNVWIYDENTGRGTQTIGSITYVTFSIGSDNPTGFEVYYGEKDKDENISSWTLFSSFTEGQNLITVGNSGDGVNQAVTLGTLDPGTVYTVTKKGVDNIGTEEWTIGTSQVLSGDSYDVPATPLRENAVFVGWYTDKDHTVAYTGTASVTEDFTIYAYYTYHENWAGNITIDLGYDGGVSGLASTAHNFAIYLASDDWTFTGWTSYVSQAEDECLVTLPYSVTFEPTLMIVVRYASTVTEEAWEADKWGTKEAQSGNQEFANHIGFSDGTTIFSGVPTVMGGVSGQDWSQIETLSSSKLNGTNHAEFYSTTVALTQGNAFKVVYNGTYYGTHSTHASLASAFSGEGDNDIEVLTSGTYCLYFDSYTKSTYITTAALVADDADEWGETFLSGIVCDGEGSITSGSWSTFAETYAALHDTVKAVFLGIAEDGSENTYAEHAVKRYDYIIKKYGTNTYANFMNRTVVYPEGPANSGMFNLISEENNNAAPIIITVSAITLAAATGLFFLLRKKRA